MKKRRFKAKKSTFGRFAKSTAKTAIAAYSALRLARKLKDAVNVEYKYKDYAYGQTPTYAGDMSYPISTIDQGIRDFERIGDSIKVQNLIIRGFCKWNNANTVQMGRIIVFWDKQARFFNGSLGGSSVLETVGSAPAVLSPKNYDKRFLSKVILDKTFTVHANRPLIEFEQVIDISQHTQYRSGDNGRETGDIVVLLISDQSTTGTSPQMEYYTRVTYSDD